MKMIISTVPGNAVATDVTLDKGEDKSDVMEVVGNAMIEVTTDWLNGEKMSKREKEMYVASLCKILRGNMWKKLK